MSMILLYNLSILLLRVGIRLASLFHPKAKLFVTGRKGVFKKLVQHFGNDQRPVVWIHCASLGEFEQGRPIMESIKREFPAYKVLLTFFSPSGYEIRKNYQQADYVTYLPLDTRSNAIRFIDAAKPSLVVFVKYEFWYHITRELKKRSIPIISISSIFRKDQFFFKPWGALPRKILNNFSHFFVQNQESVKLLNGIGLTNVTLAGDTRFDRVFEIVEKAQEIPIAKAFKNDEQLMVVGSSWSEDLDVLFPFINERKLKFIIAPHEISEEGIAWLENSLEVTFIRYSQAMGKPVEDYDVLIIDNIGMLSRLYRYGEYAFVGGAYGKGLHNILEAACYGIPILFGNKNFQKFQEALDLINRGGAFDVRDYPDLKEKFETLNNPSTFMLACEVTRQYVEENLGATYKIMFYCRQLLTSSSVKV